MEDDMQLIRDVAVLITSGVAGLMVETASAQSGSGASGDALEGELARCKALREGAATDARCQAAYKQSREQFFAPGAPYEPRAVDIFPRTPDRPLTAPRAGDSAGRQ
jgi:conjugative transfer region protein TrbK